MSSLQSLRELISERLAAAAEEICRLCEGTIVQYEQELCRQRRLLDICWKPQLQLHHIVLPQHWVTEEKDLCNQQRNFREETEDPEPPHIKEDPEPPHIKEDPEPPHIKDDPEPPHIKEDPEPPHIKEDPEPPHIKEDPEPLQIKEEQETFFISQDEDQLDLKQETETLMEFPTYEEHENREADLNNQWSFNVTDSQDDESTSTADEETEPQNRDQRKRTGRSHVQSVDCCHMSEGHCDSDVRKNLEMASLGEACTQSSMDKRFSSVHSDESSRVNNLYICMKTRSEEIVYVCKECKEVFYNLSQFIFHMKIHKGEKLFSCKECDKTFSRSSSLKSHMRTHTGEKSFTCKKCGKSFSKKWILKRHVDIFAKQKDLTCKDYDGIFGKVSSLKRHLETHTGEKPFTCIECNTSFNNISHLKTHMRVHASSN